jgi:glucose-6-phosphate dehydrogenase assembly protein OpcA
VEETLMAAAVSPARILKDLAGLWASVGRENEAGVLRACTMTLVVLTGDDDDPAALTDTIATLMPEHPSRTGVVRFDAAAAREMEARVSVQCWTAFGQRRHICCEQIEISASAAQMRDVAALLLPLVASDLPVVFWCRGPGLLDAPDFPVLAAIATKLIVDSGGMPDAPRALARLVELAQKGMVAGDLSWTRVTRWRELVASIFENRERLARIQESVEVTVGHGAAEAPAWAWYLAAWVGDALATAGAHPRISVVRAGSAPRNEFVSLSLRGGLDVQLSREGDAAIVTVDGMAARNVLTRPSDALLLAEEMSILGRDPVFEKTLPSAARLALSSTRQI